MNILELIEKKRDGGELSFEELQFFVNGVMKEKFKGSQIGALLMAITNRGFSVSEAYNYAECLADSGVRLNVSEVVDNAVDKHSTGGVSDACTLVVLPVLATLGYKVAKFSTKNIGASFGTLDRLSVFDGYTPSISFERFFDILKNVGVSVIGENEKLMPADKIIYKFREETGTVPSVPLIASSIMAKKIVMGTKTVVIDVKCGEGSLLKDEVQAEKLATLMVNIGKMAGINTTAILSNLDQPLGRSIGPMLETREALKLLNGDVELFDSDLYNMCKEMVTHILLSTKRVKSRQTAGEMFDEVIANKSAYKKLREMVKAHGGDTFAFDDLDSLIPPVNTIFVIADKTGFVTNVDTLGLYQAINVIGATESGEINRYVGLDILVREGDRIKEGDKLAKIYYSITDPNFASAVTCIRKCFNIGKTRPELNPLIKKIIF